VIATLGVVAVEVIEATVPVLALIFFFQFVVLRRRLSDVRTTLIGIAMAVAGLFLFMVGAKISLIPMGIAIGESLAGLPLVALVGFAFVVGVSVATAEPAVRIFAHEVDEVSAGSTRKRWVIAAIALAVGVAVALAVARIANGWSLAAILVPGYVILLALTMWAPKRFVPLAYDAGAVATGPVAVNFVLPLSTGLAIGLGGEGAGLLGFGVVGLVALLPIAAMLLLSIALERGRERT
jgi:hypothetical protein